MRILTALALAPAILFQLYAAVTATDHIPPLLRHRAVTAAQAQAQAAAAKWPSGSPDAGKNWTMPVNFKTFSSMKITEFTQGGENNCRVLTSGLPSSATTRPQGTVAAFASSALSLVSRYVFARSSPASVIQVDYPAGSSNPGSSPVGGCQFYAATPLALASARSVRLRYAVYFPPGWQWVQGGKLPGLYGGRTGCSGGDAAQDCWSSRMMWRSGGAGELYLYVPQNSQDPGICKVPPTTECNDAYGISEGRGAFNFTAGSWTTIEQTITLGSSASARDGSFAISVNGQRTSIAFAKVHYPAPFQGIMFSTFFGGHGEAWASPTFQQAYFRDFSVAVLR